MAGHSKWANVKHRKAAVDASRRFDRAGLTSLLQRETIRLGVPSFVRERVAPLLYDIGRIWDDGGLGIRHEHFFSEILEDHLRVLRAPLEATSKGRPVVLATLPDEHHGLGLQIVALLIAAAGRTVRILGPHLPVDEIVGAAVSMDAAAVGISISPYAVDGRTVEAVAELRELLPASIASHMKCDGTWCVSCCPLRSSCGWGAPVPRSSTIFPRPRGWSLSSTSSRRSSRV